MLLVLVQMKLVYGSDFYEVTGYECDALIAAFIMWNWSRMEAQGAAVDFLHEVVLKSLVFADMVNEFFFFVTSCTFNVTWSLY